MAGRRPFLAFALRRVAAGLALLVVASMLTFAATSVLPGDAASYALGRVATPDALESLRAELGLDRALTAQYFSWVGGLLHGDLGNSLTNQQPISALIDYRIVNTLALAAISMLIIVPLSLALGAAAGVRAGRRVDHTLSAVSLALVSLPEFVIGTMLILLFSVALGILPPVSLVRPGEDPFSHPDLLVLPVLTLVIAGVPWMVRYVRAGVAEAISSDYVAMARLNGIPERRILLRYVFPNAMAPSVQAFAFIIVWLLSGVLIVETMFDYPGLGQGLVLAITTRDVYMVQAIALLTAAMYITVTIVADLLVVLLIPKLRTAQ